MTQGRPTRRRILQATGVAIASGLAGCGGGGGTSDDSSGTGDSGETPDGELVITIGDTPHWDPETATVSVGETVVWESGDGGIHYVLPVSQPEEANWQGQPATAINPGNPYTHSFEIPGDYEFSCNYHSSRGNGSITVRE